MTFVVSWATVLFLVLKQIFKIYTTYQEAKVHAAEQCAGVAEKYNRPWLALFCIALTLFLWFGAVMTPVGPVEIYEGSGFMVLPVVAVISYFSFFLGSKIVFRPSAEELSDDTSVLAIFSACQRREMRSLISFILAFVHTAVFVGYLISKDQKLLDALSGRS